MPVLETHTILRYHFLPFTHKHIKRQVKVSLSHTLQIKYSKQFRLPPSGEASDPQMLNVFFFFF